MLSIREFGRRLSMLLHRDRFERDLQREMQFHLEMQAEENRDAGMSAAEARTAARRRFGNVTLARESSRDAWGWAGLERLAQDVRHAARALRRDRLFTSVAVLVLALGIGGNVAVFSLVDALLLHPFPYTDAERLVEIKSQPKGRAAFSTVPLPDYAIWRAQATAYDVTGTYGYTRSNLVGQSLPGFEGPERLVTGTATETFLRVLAVRPSLGRFFTRDEDRPGGPPVVVLSHRAWLRRFGGSRQVLGQTLNLNGKAHAIVGVMPANLPLPGMFTCELWVPAAFDIATNMQKGYNTRYDGDRVIARLKREVTLARAQAEMSMISRQVAQEHPERGVEWQALVVPLGSDIMAGQEERLHLLALVVVTALLLACANLAGLLLARATARSKEMAVRASLGAGRLRLVRYMLTETLMLSLAGGGLGLGLAAWGIGIIGSMAPAFMGLDSALRIDGRVVAFALALSLATGLAFGIVPAWHESKTDLTTAVKGAPAGGRPRRRGRLLSSLVVVEVSLALLLLAGGGLLAKSFLRLTQVDTGVRAAGVLTFRVGLSGSTYEPATRRTQIFDALLDRLRMMPTVTSAGGANPLPMSGEYQGGPFSIEGRAARPGSEQPRAQYCQATPGYFRAMGIPVLLGREFEASDDSTRPVALINQALAKRYFPATNPLGHRIARAGTIVGVVGDVRHNGPAQEAGPQIYYCFKRQPSWTMAFVVRTTGDPRSLMSLVGQQVRALDPELPVDRMKPMSEVVGESTSETRLITALIGGFGIFALALAAIGIYGVIAYAVSQRRQEIGIRVALGALPRSVVGLLLRRGALLAGAGIAIGLPAALGGGRLLASLLYGVSPRDAVVLSTVSLTLFAVALLASFVPARHATKIDPLDALRSE